MRTRLSVRIHNLLTKKLKEDKISLKVKVQEITPKELAFASIIKIHIDFFNINFSFLVKGAEAAEIVSAHRLAYRIKLLLEKLIKHIVVIKNEISVLKNEEILGFDVDFKGSMKNIGKRIKKKEKRIALENFHKLTEFFDIPVSYSRYSRY